MHWKYSEGGRKALFLTGLTIAAFLAFYCPETELTKRVYGQSFPTAAFCMDALAYGERKGTVEGKLMGMIAGQFPLYSYSISYFGDGMMNRYYKEYVEILMQEAKEGTGGEMSEIRSQSMTGDESKNSGPENTDPEHSGPDGVSEDEPADKTPENGITGENGVREEGEEIRLNEDDSSFLITDGSRTGTGGYQSLIHTEKVQNIAVEDYLAFDSLVWNFYTVDATTYTTAKELDIQKLVSADMKIEKGGEGPQILIYHTHAHEGYADSVEGDESTTVVGAGEQLAEILRNEYGYQVLHHTGQYDGNRDYSYSYVLPVLMQILAENPTIQVVIDLHRDSVSEDTRLVTEIMGQPMARFMFFNGLSRVREVGEIGYLPNENLQGNLAFSFQMQKVCEEYYPGLTRKIYLKGYRYNMHLKPRSLLIELGAQNNTVEEAMNACGPLARALDIVLSGE